MKNIAVFASGNGTNFSAIARAIRGGRIKAKLALLVCDNPKAGALARAEKAGVRVFLAKRDDFKTADKFEDKIIAQLKESNIELILLAGFMRILGPGLIKNYRRRIINIHPALLPSFKGAHGISDAFNYGVKFTGVTVHFVDEKMDNGPIILQEAVKIKQMDTLESLEQRIHKVEHKLYPEAIRLFLDGKLKIEGRKVRIL